jgi:hypothetical protein
MARGQIAKQEITQKLLSTFEGSFLYNGNKEIRIPMIENGETVEIKVALTCAKENVGGNLDQSSVAQTGVSATITDEEKKQVKSLIEELNL